jgi:hypothetical protein
MNARQTFANMIGCIDVEMNIAWLEGSGSSRRHVQKLAHLL